MPEKNIIEVKIFGHIYTIKSDKSEEYVQNIATKVNEKVSELRRENPKLKEMMLLNLALLYFSEENIEIETKYKDLVKKSEIPMREYTNLLNKNDTIEKEISSLEEKNNEAKKIIVQKEKEIDGYIKKKKALKREIEEKNNEIKKSMEVLKRIRNDYSDSLKLINSLQKELEEIKGKVL